MLLEILSVLLIAFGIYMHQKFAPKKVRLREKIAGQSMGIVIAVVIILIWEKCFDVNIGIATPKWPDLLGIVVVVVGKKVVEWVRK